MSEVPLHPLSGDGVKFDPTEVLGRPSARQGSSLIRKRPPPWDPPRTLGIGLG